MTRRPRTLRVPVRLPTAQARPGGGCAASGCPASPSILVLIVLFVVVLAPSLRTMSSSGSRSPAARRGRGAEAEGQGPDGERARWNDPATSDAQARERLYYVYPGEFSYLVIDDTERPDHGQTAAGQRRIQTTQVDWMCTCCRSVLTAGLTDAVARADRRARHTGSQMTTPPFPRRAARRHRTVSPPARPSRPRRRRHRRALRVRNPDRRGDRAPARGRHAVPDPLLPDPPGRDRRDVGPRGDRVMAEFAELLAADPELADAVRRARTRPTSPTASGIGEVPEIAGISAGRHARRASSACTRSPAHALAAGPGVNPIGDLALARSTWSPAVCGAPLRESSDRMTRPAWLGRDRVALLRGRVGARLRRRSRAGAPISDPRPRILARRLRHHAGLEDHARRGRAVAIIDTGVDGEPSGFHRRGRRRHGRLGRRHGRRADAGRRRRAPRQLGRLTRSPGAGHGDEARHDRRRTRGRLLSVSVGFGRRRRSVRTTRSPRRSGGRSTTARMSSTCR